MVISPLVRSFSTFGRYERNIRFRDQFSASSSGIYRGIHHEDEGDLAGDPGTLCLDHDKYIQEKTLEKFNFYLVIFRNENYFYSTCIVKDEGKKDKQKACSRSDN